MRSIKKSVLVYGLCIVMLFAVAFSAGGCTPKIYAANLTEAFERGKVVGIEPDETFINGYTEFATSLFRLSRSDKNNSAISPLSVMLAMTMVTNGADGDTRTEMEAALGNGISVEMLNRYLYYWSEALPTDEKLKLELANSIWFRNSGFDVEESFLQSCVDFYDADIYSADFDKQTIKDINNWVKSNTDGMIDKMVDEIDADDIMFIVNAIAFDAEWDVKYSSSNIYSDIFTAANGKKHSVSMMKSTEHRYIRTADAQGFIKAYKDNKYSFVALLPNEGIGINDYAASFTAEKLQNALNCILSGSVAVSMPKFSSSYEIKLNDTLKAMGIEQAFDADKANFSKLGSSEYGNIGIEKVLHKTYISVDENGTNGSSSSAAGLTLGVVEPECTLTLNRPFLYMILDNATNMPIFIGTVMDPAE